MIKLRKAAMMRVQTYDHNKALPALKIAQIETGNRRTEFFEFDLAVIVGDVVELYEPLAAEKGIGITSNVAGSVKMVGDCDLLFQAAANLLDNAIKYTPANGAIEITLSHCDHTPAYWCRITA